MSGAEAVLVLGVISSIVSIVDGIKKVYDAVKNAQGLPRSFRTAAGQLPIITGVLSSIDYRIKNGEIHEDVCNEMKAIVDACEGKAKELDKVFKKAIATNDATGLERYYKAVEASMKKDEVEASIKEIMDDIVLLNFEQSRNIAAKLEKLAGRVDELTQHVIKLHKPAQDDITACMSALQLTDPREDRGRLTQWKGSRVDGTCEWIKTNALYLSWLSSDSQLLWVSGLPGKGKTMISIFLAEELEQVAKRSQNTLLLQYFCDNKDDKRNTAVCILRGLIYQLLAFRPQMLDYIVPSFKIRGESLFAGSSVEALWVIFETMLRDPNLSTTYCVLDGLDECDKASLDALLKKLKVLFSKNSGEALPFHLNLIILTRDFPNIIPEILFDFPRIRLDADSDTEVNNDIRHFINVKVDELSTHQDYSESVREHVKRVFYNRAEGTFLWVGIVAESLRNLSESDVMRELHLFPAGLEPLYDRMLLQIEDDQREIIAKILRWVVMAARPLTLSELSAAIGISPLVESLVEISCEEEIRNKIAHCRYFLNMQGDEVHLIHKSAKDYLLRQRHNSNNVLETFRIKEADSNLEIAWKCLDYLQSGALADGEVDLKVDLAHLKAYPLLSYAALHWHEHTKSLSCSEDIFDLSLPFYNKDSQARISWLKTYILYTTRIRDKETLAARYESFTSLDLASYLGILPLAQNVLKKGSKTKVERLLNKNKGKEDKNTALVWAAQQGHLAIVQLLLANGANVEGRATYVKASLSAPAKSGMAYKMRRAFRNRADTRGADRLGKSALYAAAQWGHESMVRLLLQKGANVRAENYFGDTALLAAVWTLHIDIVRLLLDRGADIEHRDIDGETALSWAAEYGIKELVELLLEKGADIDAKGKEEHIALTFAAKGGHESMVQLLLQKGANVNATGGNGGTALIWAAEKGNKFIVQLLVQEGADIEAKDEDGKTAIMVAAQNENGHIVKMLVDLGAHVEAGEDQVRVNRLLEQEAERRARYERILSAQPPLSESSEPAQQELVELLITNPQLTETDVVE